MSRAAVVLVGALLLSACSEPVEHRLTRELCVDTLLVLERPPHGISAAMLRSLSGRLQLCHDRGLL